MKFDELSNAFYIIDFNKENEDNLNEMYIKNYSGENSYNISIKKNIKNQQSDIKTLKIHFNFFKLNGIFFVNINGENLFDFKKLVLIDYIKEIKNVENVDSIRLIIKNSELGELIIDNCDVQMFQKGMKLLNEWKRKKKKFLDILNFIF